MKHEATLEAVPIAAAVPAGVTVRASNADTRAAVRVGAWTLSQPALALLQRVARIKQADASIEAVTAAAIEDHVVGTHARATIDDDALFDNRFVALTPQASAEATLYASIEAAWRAELEADLGRNGVLRSIRQHHPLTREGLQRHLGVSPQVRLDGRLSAAQEAALDEVALLDWRMDGGRAGRITLGDVWRRMTMQERVVLYRGNCDYAMQRAKGLVGHALVREWILAHTALDTADLTTLQSLFGDHDRRIAFARWAGAVDDDHYRSGTLERLRRAVSAAAIRAWYDAHPDDFKRIERVHARHIQCLDEATCQAASAALQRGEPFPVVASHYSIALDATQGGDLGWIGAERSRREWLAQLAFAQPPGPPTEPLREPSTHGGVENWQIVQVLDRVYGRHAVDSEAVRFGASRAIARQQAVTQYRALRDRLLVGADIELNAALLGFDLDALAWNAQG